MKLTLKKIYPKLKNLMYVQSCANRKTAITRLCGTILCRNHACFVNKSSECVDYALLLLKNTQDITWETLRVYVVVVRLYRMFNIGYRNISKKSYWYTSNISIHMQLCLK